MSDVFLKKMRIVSEEVDVFVGTDGGFKANVAGGWVLGSTLTELTERIARTLKKASVRVSVPFAILEKLSARQGNLTGMHQTHGKVLVHWADGAKTQMDTYVASNLLRPLTAEEAEELGRLAQAREAAYQALHNFMKARRLDGTKAVREAIERALAKATGH